jgi:hypothetical protein
MSAFKILNSNKEAIAINALDKEAAEFWKKEVKPRSYATPTPEFINTNNLEGRELMIAEWDHSRNEKINWFDLIGWHIANPKVNYTTGWKNIKCSILSVHTESLALYSYEEQKILLEAANNYVKPYFDLIDHWCEKGFIPVQIKE